MQRGTRKQEPRIVRNGVSPRRWPTPSLCLISLPLEDACAVARRSPPLPVDRPLLARIHGFLIPRLEQERLHVPREELARLRIHEIESVMVDEHGLLLQPQPPAVDTDLGQRPRPDRSRKRSPIQPGRRPSAPGADDLGHYRAYFTFASPNSESRRM